MHWRRKWQPTPVFLPGESQGWRSLLGYGPRGRRVGRDWSRLARIPARAWERTYHFLCSFPWTREVPAHSRCFLWTAIIRERKQKTPVGFSGSHTSLEDGAVAPGAGTHMLCRSASSPSPKSCCSWGVYCVPQLPQHRPLWNLFHNCFRAIKSLWCDPCQQTES